MVQNKDMKVHGILVSDATWQEFQELDEWLCCQEKLIRGKRKALHNRGETLAFLLQEFRVALKKIQDEEKVNEDEED